MKTLDRYKDKVAKAKGYSSFGEFQTSLIEGLTSLKDIVQLERLENFMDEVISLTNHSTTKEVKRK